MKMKDLRKLKFDQLVELAQNSEVFVWHDATKPDLLDALKRKLIDGDETVWCC